MGDLISGFEQVVGSETSEKSTEVTRKSGKGQGSEEFQKAEFWVNVGVTSKNADGEEVFLSLPKGIALDGLKAKPVPNKASPFQAIRESEAALFDQLMKLAHSLKPGEVKNLKLSVQLRRTNEKEETGTLLLSKGFSLV